jgi:hypothetical protein
MPRDTMNSLRAQILDLQTKIAALSAAPAAPSPAHVVAWASDAQRRFWTEKACYALSKLHAGARSFPSDVVTTKAAELFTKNSERRTAH